MREFRSYGSVRGAPRNWCLYRDKLRTLPFSLLDKPSANFFLSLKGIDERRRDVDVFPLPSRLGPPFIPVSIDVVARLDAKVSGGSRVAGVQRFPGIP
ncbi:MAG: hypothetical protein ACREBE_06125 [bacterium]